MFGTQDLWLFAVTVLVLNATPGVDLMLTLARTLQFGVRAGFAAALGIAAGCVVHTLAAAFGLAALLAASGTAFNVIKWAGALYLLWLAWGMLRNAWRGSRDPELSSRREPGSSGGSQAASTQWIPASAGMTEGVASGGMTGGAAGGGMTQGAARAESRSPALGVTFRQGFLTNALNPKVALFFLALLPQFIAADAASKELAFLFLGGWFVLQGAAFLLLFVVCVAPLRRWAVPPAGLRALNAGGAALFSALAARLALAESA